MPAAAGVGTLNGVITARLIEDRIREALPDAEVVARDMTGTADHWEVRIVSAAFEGKLPLARHRLVYAMFEAEMEGSNAPIHAMTLRTLTPAQAAQGG